MSGQGKAGRAELAWRLLFNAFDAFLAQFSFMRRGFWGGKDGK
jgi:hypothetical protein